MNPVFIFIFITIQTFLDFLILLMFWNTGRWLDHLTKSHQLLSDVLLTHLKELNNLSKKGGKHGRPKTNTKNK